MSAENRISIQQSFVLCLCSALAGAALVAGLFAMRPARAVAQDAPKAAEAKAKTSCPVVHFDIGCKDLNHTTDFYSKLFDWKIEKKGLAGYIDTGTKDGVQGHITALGHEPEHYVTFYVQVDDIKACLDKVGMMGGKTVVPPITIPTGKFAWFSDPEGNMIGLLQPKAPAPKQ